MGRTALVLLLFGYHRLVSACLPRACRFHPTCSMYMAEAVRRYGIFKGVAAGLARICRCHPWHTGGYDPVR